MDIKVRLDGREASVRKIFTENGTTLLTAGYRSYLVDGTIRGGSDAAHVLIGSYASLGPRMTFLFQESFGSSYASGFAGTETENDPMAAPVRSCGSQVIIGSDVWIGCDVTIHGGVYIGNGAVVGAGAVVTENVPPYTVVVGNPARVIKKRFDAETIARLQHIKWWYWPAEQIQQHISLLLGDVRTFIARFSVSEEQIPSEPFLENLIEFKERGYILYYFIPDFESEEAIWRNVFRDYLGAYTVTDHTALLLALPDDTPEAFLTELGSMLAEAGEDAPLVMTCYANTAGIVSIWSYVDSFITTKEAVSSVCAEYAADSGVNIVYGLAPRARIFPALRKNVASKMQIV